MFRWISKKEGEEINKLRRERENDLEEKRYLEKQIKELKNELEDLKGKKVIELRDIEHMVKVKEEKNAIELQKKTLDVEKQYQEKVMVMTNQNHERSLQLIENAKKEMKEVFNEIIKRLPNVNMEIKKRG